jgi:hypothetical protein
MNAYRITSFFGMLMATSLISGAVALEVNQTRAPATGETPAFALPAFLDGARLPDFQDAWRAHFGEGSEPAMLEPASDITAPTPSADQAAMEAARQAITRAEQASREAAAVRARAEELSRRFGADGLGGSVAGAPDTTATDTGAGPGASTETASIGTDTSADRSAQPVVEHVLAPAEDDNDTSAAATPTQSVAATTNDAPASENIATKPVKRAKVGARIPSREAAQAAPNKPIAVKATPTRTAADDTPPDKADTADAAAPMPMEIRAFGWNAQP